MPQFFFDVTDGSFMPDFDGTELAGVEAARAHAIALCAELLAADPAKFWKGEEWLIEAKDDAGLVLFAITFRAREAPLVRARRPTPLKPEPADR